MWNKGGGVKLEASVVVQSRSRNIETVASLLFGASITTVTDSTIEVLPSCVQQVDGTPSLQYESILVGGTEVG